MGQIQANGAGCWVPTARPSSRRVANKTIRLWDLANGREIRRFGGANAETRHIAFSRDGTKLASTETRWTGPCPSFWEDQDDHANPRLGHGDGPGDPQWQTDNGSDVCSPPDGTTLATVGMQVIRLWDVATGSEIPSRDREAERLCDRRCSLLAGWSMDRDGRHDRTIHFWDAATGKEIRQLERARPASSSWSSRPTAKPWRPATATSLPGSWKWPPGGRMGGFQLPESLTISLLSRGLIA